MQSQIRDEWQLRTRDQIEFERVAAQVRAAVYPGPGHDFKKTLAVLAAYGSRAARQASIHQGAHPATVLDHATSGQTLRDAAGWIWIEPPDAATTWLSINQAASVRAFLDDAAHDGDDLREAVLTVETDALGSAHLVHLDRVLELAPERPSISTHVDPVVHAFLVGGMQKIVSLASSEFPRRTTLARISAALDIVGVIWFAQHPPARDHRYWTIAPVAASSALFCLSVARGDAIRTNRYGNAVFPASAGVQSIMLVAERYGTDLVTTRWVLRLLASAMWVSAEILPQRRPLGPVIAEIVPLALQPLVTTGIAQRVRFESAALQRHLADEFRDRVAAERLAAADDELARYGAQLELAEHELDSPDVGVPDDIRAALAQECKALRSWLTDPTTRNALAGL